ncbi:hypothetical protein, partial [Oscillibacter sp.]|uniref:hypothetical protein n=1 Tax=Oscillibacter sp. TaxID=1945593 RepID=UPI002D7F05C9
PGVWGARRPSGGCAGAIVPHGPGKGKDVKVFFVAQLLIVWIAQTFVKILQLCPNFLAFLCIVFRKNSQYNVIVIRMG